MFGSGARLVFGMIDDIVNDLQNGTNVNPRINDVDAALQRCAGRRRTWCVRHATALGAQDALKTTTVSLENRRSGIEDKDLAQAVLDPPGAADLLPGSPRRSRRSCSRP